MKIPQMAQAILFIAMSLHLISIFFQTNALKLKMIPIDAPELQVMPQDFTPHYRHHFLSNISLSRALSLPRNRARNDPNAASFQLFRLLSSFYVIQLSFGSGPTGFFNPFVLLDTGSDQTWVQCDGCNPCFEVTKSFPYTQSTSFAPMSVHDSRCTPQIVYGADYCGFYIQYQPAKIEGLVGTETFRIVDGNTKRINFYPGVVLQCGLQNVDVSFGDNTGAQNLIAGIMGIAPGPRSFLTQLDSEIKGVFSYCIPSWTEQTMAYSTLNFGDDAHVEEPDKLTQVISMNGKFRYHLYCVGITVDGTQLPIDPAVFELDEQQYTKGFFIDSGAPYTVLAKSAYDPLQDAMIQYFNKYSWQPIPQGTQAFDLCYSSYPDTNQGQSFPQVVFHFKLGDIWVINMVLNQDNMFQKFRFPNNGDGFCMMVHSVPDPGPCLYGAFQQANFRILYDVPNSFLYFVDTKCQENNH